MAEKKPNRTCRYSHCHAGQNGKRKEYYACGDCDTYNSWKAFGCCFEHYLAWQNEVALSRGQDMPFPEVFDTMVEDGALVLDKPKAASVKPKKARVAKVTEEPIVIKEVVVEEEPVSDELDF